ncbi:AAA family ATPase [Planococcus sp. ISL-109]|uniref:AAA family ATPase n=1 Tax=Planococcus sp. ISL-109 TaxID=2819166 RepID=UPI001BEB9FF2|nr:AAA family ATPase [Planococcus sp. ISL-109]MBT2582627.1 AAA family ATPase [Planococcus sp. ISL-109]
MKIQIIGGSGTGKSTLAKYISEQQAIKWIDTDNYLWKDNTFTENRPVEERKKMYAQDMESTDSYAASGSVFSWLPEGLNARNLLVFLYLTEPVRMDRLRKREKERNSRLWKDTNGEDMNDFLEWYKTYLTEKDKNMAGTYAEHAHQMEISKSPVLKLDSSQTVERLYGEILNSFTVH